MRSPDDPKCNRVVAALPYADWRRWHPQLELVELKLGQVLYESGRPQRHATFPTSAVVSILYLTESGASSEIAVVGNEGTIGTSLFLGGETTTSRATVLIAGRAFRLRAQAIRDEFERSDTVRHLLLRYTQALLVQIAQTAVCNRYHSIDQQLCGWLLGGLDRVAGRDVTVTQELMASLLGVRRESVTTAAGKLQAAGLIRCTRGHVEALDRRGLERRACECHAVVKKEFDRLLPPEPDARAPDAGWRPWPAWTAAAVDHRTPPCELAATGAT